MIDELTIYNLSVKHPDTISFVRAVERMTVEKTVRSLNDHISCMYCPMYAKCRSSIRCVENLTNYVLEQMKGES